MKVTIIGGGGLVGSCAAFALQTGGLVRQIALIDANAELAAGQALDLLHGSSVAADQVICAGGYVLGEVIFAFMPGGAAWRFIEGVR